MLLQEYVDQNIQKIAPIHGVSFGNLDDIKSWRIDFKNEATDKQKSNAQAYIDNFKWDTQTQADAARLDQIEETKEMANQPLFKFAYQQYKTLNPLSTQQDFIDYLKTL